MLADGSRDKVREKLEAIAGRELGRQAVGGEADRLAAELAGMRRDEVQAGDNLAVAVGPVQFRAVAAALDRLAERERRLEADLAAASQTADPAAEVRGDRVPGVAGGPHRGGGGDGGGAWPMVRRLGWGMG